MSAVKYLITYQYSEWLKQYWSKNRINTLKKTINDLTRALPSVSSAQELLHLLNRYIPEKNEISSGEKTPIYGPVLFYTQLTKWQAETQKTIADFQSVTLALNSIEITPENAPLMRLFSEINKEPKTLLHTRIQSLFQILRKAHSQEVIQYVLKLAHAVKPVNPPSGSFAAIIPINEDHAFCLSLLNNIAAVYNDEHDNPLWMDANNLLQSTLIIFQDMEKEKHRLTDDEEHMVEISLIDTSSEQHEPQRSCIWPPCQLM